MLIVDASALTAVILKEEEWDKILRLFTPAYSIDHVIKETMNAIWKMANVKKLIDVRTALEMKRILFDILKEKTLILLNEMDYVEEAFNIAINNNLTFYDSLYIAACLRHGATLITRDVKQAEVAGSLGVKVEIP
ncbi:PIN domain-containing protein [Sulfolobus sp. A20]|uniref:type II toxin-antitoxin system VapC family toxin n=1 Tax=Sulfolobaceae TaxID=118883 RepID=UPI000845E339|nr:MULTISPECIES: type II toxin-antitoxin system VapC family toxin [unclassified Sulfolobus]TRM75936.1 PIN domain-containing protein [Sulfolobus sp. A20-N-F8]TRM76542.1 PIN domain-containing protein [Sulfolobus sp. E5]TRM79062.1 PIN domain-containing protein [Sulfolobus sp. B5]TRM82255.1 PIN domain-containing protein [Sulfolobus sp. D5]TRM84540.1 PIN domain-containing protein [Sulfolobus sp. F3]TRM87985.1 PIN domain-containing protein [Sulfolobus sp. C3]TRM89013.1 PIN domain-containing protei